MSSKNSIHRESRFTYVLNIVLLILIVTSIIYFIVEWPNWGASEVGQAKEPRTSVASSKSSDKESVTTTSSPESDLNGMEKYIQVRLNNFDVISEGATPGEAKDYLKDIKTDIDSLPDGKSKNDFNKEYEQLEKSVKEQPKEKTKDSTEIKSDEKKDEKPKDKKDDKNN